MRVIVPGASGRYLTRERIEYLTSSSGGPSHDFWAHPALTEKILAMPASIDSSGELTPGVVRILAA